MLKMYKKLVYSTLLSTFLGLLFMFVGTHEAHAACGIYALMTASTKNVSWSTGCTETYVDGVDNANADTANLANTASLTFTGTPTMIIASGGRLIAGSMTASNASFTVQSGGKIILKTLTIGTGSILIQSGGTLSVDSTAGIWVKDGDSDGWVHDYTTTAEFLEATASGSRRLGLMKAYATTTAQNDCNDAALSLTNTCYAYAQSAYYGYGQGSYYTYSQSAYYGYGQGSYAQSY